MSECYPIGCAPCTQPISFPEYPSDDYYHPDGDVDLTQTPAVQSLRAGDVYKVTVPSQSQSFLDTNYDGLTHPVGVNSRVTKNNSTNKWREVHPTTYCVDIGEDKKKCWTYDKCIPGWRAQGPSASPAVYRGGIDIKTQAPGANVDAGHFYIQTETVTSPYQPEWGVKVNAVSPVVQNNRIAFNGQDWEVIPGPEVPYAEEARDINPFPDDRIGGITKNASLQDALAGTKKCDAITPYTLSNYVEEEIGKIVMPTVGDGALTIQQGSNVLAVFGANQDNDERCTIPMPGNGIVTLFKNGTAIGSFSMNQGSNKDINITVPDINDPDNPTVPTNFEAVGTYTFIGNAMTNQGGELRDRPIGSTVSFPSGNPRIGTWRIMGEKDDGFLLVRIS